MSDKRYTAQGMRDTAQCLHYNHPCALNRGAAAMLRQAAETEEELIKAKVDAKCNANKMDLFRKERNALQARLDEVVKNLEDMRKYCAFACVDTEDVDVIINVARGDGGAK